MGGDVSIRIGVLCAMRSELAPVRAGLGLAPTAARGRRLYQGEVTGADGPVSVVAAVTEMGTAAAREAAEWFLDVGSPDHLLVVGVAGGVDRSLAVGDVVVPEFVIDRGTETTLRATPLHGVVAAGTIVTSDELQYGATMHAYLASCGATAVDMETASIAKVCEDRGVPWSAVRAISDMVDDHAEDYDVFHLARPDGSPDPVAALRYVVRHPGRIPYLMALGRGAGSATAAASRTAIRIVTSHPWRAAPSG